MTQAQKKSFFDGFFGKYLLPGIVLQSVLVGGGYATGREVVSFGGKFGAYGWIGGIGIFLGFTILSVLTFEIARIFKVYNYKSIVQQFSWKFSVLFDIFYMLLAVIVIAVMASATGEIVKNTLGMNYWLGVTGVIIIVGILNFYGSRLIEKFETYGTIALYVGYMIFGFLVISKTWPHAQNVFATMDTSYMKDAPFNVGTILWTGIIYCGYNLVVYPASFFTLERQTKRKEAVWAGIFSGVLMTLPWFLSYFAIMGFYPSTEIMDAPVPWLAMLQTVAGPWVGVVFGAVVGWTLIETSTGVIHALVERVNAGLVDMGRKPFTPKQNAMLTVCILVIATALSKIGVIDLIGKGYTMLAYGMIAVYVIPILTIGVYRIIHPEWKKEFWNQEKEEKVLEKVEA